jgi:hypothetical protein
MAISKDDLLTFVNAQLRRSETDIDIQIENVLGDLIVFPFLEEQDTSLSLDDGDVSFDLPDNYKDHGVISIVFNDGSVNLAPLLPMPGGYKGYRQAMEEFTSGDKSPPKYYAVFDGKCYIYPTANQTYTITFDYYKKNALDADSIEYGDEYTNLFKFGAAFYTAMRYGLTKYIAIWEPKYQNKINEMILAHPGQPKFAGGN